MALILDNGSYSLKIGFSKDEHPCSVPNSVFKSKAERRRIFVGSEIEECKDLSGLFYVAPFQKGFLVNWDVQRQIWDHAFGPNMLNVSCDSTNLLMTEPVFNFPSVRESHLEVFFEEYSFNSMAVTHAPLLSCYNYSSTNGNPPCCLVVDMGYAFTHVVPFYKNRMIQESIRRIDVGGKFLTNFLKEIVSYRQLQVLDETYVMNQVKEDVCYVSLSFEEEMKQAQGKGQDNTVALDYVLPDFTSRRRGFIRFEPTKKGKKDEQGAEEQNIRLANERITVPEMLFHPSDLGMKQMGVAEAICHSIASTPSQLHPHLFNNIVLTGGSACFRNMKHRVYQDVRKLAAEEYPVRVHLPDSPDLYAWSGGQMAAQNDALKEWSLKGSDYRELGAQACLERMHSRNMCTFAEEAVLPSLSEI